MFNVWVKLVVDVEEPTGILSGEFTVPPVELKTMGMAPENEFATGFRNASTNVMNAVMVLPFPLGTLDDNVQS